MKPLVVTATRVHDSRLQAVYGLYDFEIGATAEAKALLTAATQGHVARPAAYLALAQINYDEALRHPAGAGGRFSSKQTAAVLKPLFAVQPPGRLGVESYVLVAETWVHSDRKPTIAILADLSDGLNRYPFDPTLTRAVAEAYAEWGYVPEAAAIIDHGLGYSDDDTAAQLVALRASLKPVK
jgi:hypothetical protein